MKHLFVIALLALTILPVLATAATMVGQDPNAIFVPLAPIPVLNEGYESLPDYLNAVFSLVIGVGAILAVIMIVYNGLQYMTQEAVTEKKDAIGSIRGAVLGLLLLLGSFLILFVINPEILELNALTQSLQKRTDYVPPPPPPPKPPEPDAEPVMGKYFDFIQGGDFKDDEQAHLFSRMCRKEGSRITTFSLCGPEKKPYSFSLSGGCKETPLFSRYECNPK